MIEDLEFAISQYLDGSLPAAQEAELRQRLAKDAGARALLEEYRKLDGIIRANATPMPQMNWDALAGQISESIARQDKEPQSYKIAEYRRSPWLARRAWMAIAASLLIAAGVAFQLTRQKSAGINPAPSEQIAKAQVQGPAAEMGTGPSVAEVTLTPPAATAEASRQFPYADGIVVEPSHVTIASATVR